MTIAMPIVSITGPDEDDLFEILTLLKDEQARCYNTATWLKLRPSLVETIEKETPDHAQAMKKIITNWLQGNYNVKKFGHPTWKVLVEAVAAPNGGNNSALARKIAECHQGM